MSCKEASAFPAEDLLTERIAFRAVTVAVCPMLLHEFLPAVKFLLNRIPCFLINDSLMAVLYIDLCHFPVILYLTLGKKISRIGFLQ